MILYHLVAVPVAILNWIIEKADELFGWIAGKMAAWREHLSDKYKP